MFLSKLSVALTTQRRVLLNSIRSPKFFHQSGKYEAPADKGKLCPKPEVKTSVVAESRCEKYKESLGKCSGKQSKSTCKAAGTVDSRTKEACGARHAAEMFSQALAKVRNQALTIQIRTRNSVNAIAASMDLENATNIKTERNRASKRLGDVLEKINEITNISFKCGSVKRNILYAMNDQIYASLQVWECENVAGEDSVKRRLEELECTVKERTDTAVALVRTCKGCVNPESLKICVEASENDANCILSMTDKHVETEVKSIEELKKLVLQENCNAIQRIMHEFEETVVEFEKHLCDCIAQLKKMKKR